MEEIREEKGKSENSVSGLPFQKAGVQLAKLEKSVPTGENWLYELKYDGYRIIAYIEDGTVRLMTRNGQDYTEKFPDITEALKGLNEDMVLDGEIVVFDENGKSDFQKLQSFLFLRIRMKTSGNTSSKAERKNYSSCSKIRMSVFITVSIPAETGKTFSWQPARQGWKESSARKRTLFITGQEMATG